MTGSPCLLPAISQIPILQAAMCVLCAADVEEGGETSLPLAVPIDAAVQRAGRPSACVQRGGGLAVTPRKVLQRSALVVGDGSGAGCRLHRLGRRLSKAPFTEQTIAGSTVMVVVLSVSAVVACTSTGDANSSQFVHLSTHYVMLCTFTLKETATKAFLG
eukprot:365139-Chlamydomonas_euryale.AAC.20